MGFALRAELLIDAEHPQLVEIQEKISAIDEKVGKAFEEWKTNQPGRFEVLRRLSSKKVEPHASAPAPFNFDEVNLETVARRAKLHKMIITGMLIAGAILIGIAICAPLAMVPAVAAIPIAYLVIIGVSLLSGAIGAASFSAAILNKDCQSRLWQRANKDKFKAFVKFAEEKLQFHFSEPQLKDHKLHRLFRTFDSELLEQLKDYQKKVEE